MQMYVTPLSSNKGLCTFRADKISLPLLKYYIDLTKFLGLSSCHVESKLSLPCKDKFHSAV